VTERRDRSLLLLLTGGFAVWLVWSGTALNFVRRAMLPYVLVAGVIAMLLAVLPPHGLLSRRVGVPDHEDDGHGHGPGVGVGWLLVLPVLIGLLVPPAPLGANAVRSRLVSQGVSGGVYPPVGSPVGGAVPMSMAEFFTRALRDSRQSLRDVRVRLVGFVSEPAAGTYRLGRFVIFCCAADAEAVVVTVVGDTVPRKADQWLEVEGTWVPGPGEVPRLAVTSVRTVHRPGEPYEYTTIYAG
jgi:uncharacterized repeat protein (TIGR03943 family)